jgi:adenine-specific DNA methylase
MNTPLPKRLIEVDLPIKRISAHARREKVIHQGNISTLHIWWARRPLAACRAVICAALWPDPADEHCPSLFVEAATREMTAWARDHATLASAESFPRLVCIQKNPQHLSDPRELRATLLDFIADFANWDNSTLRDYVNTSRALTQAAHEALSGVADSRPLVLDPFAGGGAIPLEALRVGADAFASELNPVAVLLNKVVLEYIPKYGERIADEVSRWGRWIKKEADKTLGEFYPKDPDGATPIAYLWARTIQCEGPACGVTIPLIRNMQITRDGQKWHLAWSYGPRKRVGVTVGARRISTSRPSVAGGSATCPRKECGYTTPAAAVRVQLERKSGGATDAMLLAVCVQLDGVRRFRDPSRADLTAIRKAKVAWQSLDLPSDRINPIRPYKNTRGLSAVTRIGMTAFSHLYTERQALALRCFQSVLLGVPASEDPDLRRATLSILHCAMSRLIFQNCSLSRWHATRSTIEGAFGKQALQVVWDFAEANPLGGGPANWEGALDWVLRVVAANKALPQPAAVARLRAQDQALPDDAANALITDPPYFAAIPYSDLSNVFFVWEREFFKVLHPDLYAPGLVEQEDEIIVTNANRGRDGAEKSPEFYRAEMVKALEAGRRAVRDDGIGVVVFADSRTDSWEAILGAVIDAGWTVTGSWPIDTELQTRTQAEGSASLQSSIHIACRPRKTESSGRGTDEVGDWRDVLSELPARIHAWMPRLAKEGVVGADAIFACLGPALEIFSRFERVEKASDERVKLSEYLEHVWAAVAKEALGMIFSGADAGGFDEDARLTAMWLWTLKTGEVERKAIDGDEHDDSDEEEAANGKKTKKRFGLDFDSARKIAQGLGAHLEDLGGIVEVVGQTARLLTVSERARTLFGKDEGRIAGGRRRNDAQMGLFKASRDADGSQASFRDSKVASLGDTVLDRVHQSMILFAAGRGEALKRFLVEDGAGRDQRFWQLAQALSALYPVSSDEKRWVDGVMARKKALGL